MKTLNSFISKLLAITVIAVSGCSKSSDPSISLANTTWRLTNETIVGCSDPSGNHNTPCSSGCPIIKLTSNTYTVTTNGTLEESGTYSISGNTLTLTQTGGSPRANTFTLSGNTLTVVFVTEATGCVKTVILAKQ